MNKILQRFAEGNAKLEELDMLWEICKQIEGHSICALGDGASWVAQGILRRFRPTIEERIKKYEESKRQSVAC